jgi:hypothetical protein
VEELSMAQACKEQYNLPIVRARVADHYNAASIQCWGSRTTPPVPAAPSDISVSITSHGYDIGVSWKDNSNNEAGFDIFNGVEHLLVSPNQTFISYDWHLQHDQNNQLLSGQYMCFQVSAYNATGSSMPTPWSCIEVPGQQTPPPPVQTTVIFQAPFSRYISSYHHSPVPGSPEEAVCKGLSGFPKVQTDKETGLIGYSGFAWGGFCSYYNLFSANKPPAQQSTSESLLGNLFTAPVSGTYRIDAEIELHGKGTASAGAGAADIILFVGSDLLPESIKKVIGLATSPSALPSELARLTNPANLFPSVASAQNSLTLRVGNTSSSVSNGFPNLAVDSLLHTDQDELFSGTQTVTTNVHLNAGQQIVLLSGLKTDIKAWGNATAVVNSLNAKLNKITVQLVNQ